MAITNLSFTPFLFKDSFSKNHAFLFVIQAFFHKKALEIKAIPANQSGSSPAGGFYSAVVVALHHFN